MFDPAEWLQSGRDAMVNSVPLRPRAHPNNRVMPLATSLGQATVFYLDSDRGREWMLKKFNPGRAPDAVYVGAIRALVPRETGFESGSERQCLTGSMISPDGYTSAAFAAWIEGTILMPRVRASSWSDFLGGLRDGLTDEDLPARISIAEDVCRKVVALEEGHIAHRDLSATNVMIDDQRVIHFIDWDSLYAPSLRMPTNTTIGTPGYTAPYMHQAGDDPAASWMAGADRFALAVLVLEALAAQRGCAFAGDGCLLEQNEIQARGGATLDAAVAAAGARANHVVALFEKALAAKAPRQCPAPREWLHALHRSRPRVSRVPTRPLPGFITLDPRNFVALDPSRFVALQR
jgi:hypothetical protein